MSASVGGCHDGVVPKLDSRRVNARRAARDSSPIATPRRRAHDRAVTGCRPRRHGSGSMPVARRPGNARTWSAVSPSTRLAGRSTCGRTFSGTASRRSSMRPCGMHKAVSARSVRVSRIRTASALSLASTSTTMRLRAGSGACSAVGATRESGTFCMTCRGSKRRSLT